jgi:acetyl esterase/lipase
MRILRVIQFPVWLILLSSLDLFILAAGDPLPIWPGMAPGETTRKQGTLQPFRPNELPPVTRVTNITEPTMTVHLAKNGNGAAALILPGGGFAKVVTNKEGTEIAAWLNKLGISVFVLSYRTRTGTDRNGWLKPLQDAQRAMALIRSNAQKWKIDSKRLGLIGFSAGGHVATRLLCDQGKTSYKPIDAVDQIGHRPAFAILIYPWNIYDKKSENLVDQMKLPEDCPPVFLVHTDDDRSTALGPVFIYSHLKRRGISSELHIYGNGGHGYGMRNIPGSKISTWPDHATNWLQARGLAEAMESAKQ